MISSSRSATRHAPMIVRARTSSTPARCHSQDGMSVQVRGGGQTRIPGGAGPGAGSPNLSTSSRHARLASAPTTFCSSTAGTSASNTRPDRPIRSAGCRRSISPSSGCTGVEPGRVVVGAQQRRAGWRAATPRPGPRRIAQTVGRPPATWRPGRSRRRAGHPAGPLTRQRRSRRQRRAWRPSWAWPPGRAWRGRAAWPGRPG